MAESTHEGDVVVESVEDDAQSVDTVPLEGESAEDQLGEESAMDVEVGAAESEAQKTDKDASDKQKGRSRKGRKRGKGAETGDDLDLEITPRDIFLFNTSEATQFIDDVCEVLNLTAIKPQLKPADADASEKTPNWANFPPVEEFESIIKSEWKNVGKKWSMLGHQRKMYPFPKEWTKTWVPSPTVDSVISDFVKNSVITQQGRTVPKDGIERRIDYASQRAFSISGQIVTAASAASYVAQALISWLDQFSQALPEGLKEHKNLPLIQSSAKYLSDASHNIVKAAARASVAQTTARRALWLCNVDTTTGLKNHMLNLPFKGGQLFGDGVNELMKQVREAMRKEQAKQSPGGRLQSLGVSGQGMRGSLRGPMGGYSLRGIRGGSSLNGFRGGSGSRGGKLSFSAKFAAVRASLRGRGRGRRGRRSFRGGSKSGS